MPRPRALDDIKRREICALVSAGCCLETAANYVGCNVVTIRRESFRNPEFHDQLRDAQLSSQISPLHAIRKAAESDWRAATWLLERTNPNQFARRNPNQFTYDQIEQFLVLAGEVIGSVLPDAEMADRVVAVLQEEIKALESSVRAGEKPRRDPRGRRRTPPHLPPPADVDRDRADRDRAPPVERLDRTPPSPSLHPHGNGNSPRTISNNS